MVASFARNNINTSASLQRTTTEAHAEFFEREGAFPGLMTETGERYNDIEHTLAMSHKILQGADDCLEALGGALDRMRIRKLEKEEIELAGQLRACEEKQKYLSTILLAVKAEDFIAGVDLLRRLARQNEKLFSQLGRIQFEKAKLIARATG